MSFYAQSPLASSLFELLAEDERRMLAEVGGTVHLAAQQILFQTGEPGGTLYVVESGKVEIYIKDNAGQKILLKTASAGDFFGEVSLFDGRPRTATAVAVSESRLLALSREDLLAALGGMLRVADKLLQTTVARNVNEMMEKTMSPLETICEAMSNTKSTSKPKWKSRICTKKPTV